MVFDKEKYTTIYNVWKRSRECICRSEEVYFKRDATVQLFKRNENYVHSAHTNTLRSTNIRIFIRGIAGVLLQNQISSFKRNISNF